MVPLFSELPEARRLQIGQLLEFRAFSPGEVIARQGDHDRGVYMLLQGRIKATFRSSVDDEDDKLLSIMEKVSAASQQRILNRPSQQLTRLFFSKGAVMGEIALLTGAPRSATLRAQENCTLLYLAGKRFRHFAPLIPELSSSLIELARARRKHSTDSGDETAHEEPLINFWSPEDCRQIIDALQDKVRRLQELCQANGVALPEDLAAEHIHLADISFGDEKDEKEDDAGPRTFFT